MPIIPEIVPATKISLVINRDLHPLPFMAVTETVAKELVKFNAVVADANGKLVTVDGWPTKETVVEMLHWYELANPFNPVTVNSLLMAELQTKPEPLIPPVVNVGKRSTTIREVVERVTGSVLHKLVADTVTTEGTRLFAMEMLEPVLDDKLPQL